MLHGASIPLLEVKRRDGGNILLVEVLILRRYPKITLHFLHILLRLTLIGGASSSIDLHVLLLCFSSRLLLFYRNIDSSNVYTGRIIGNVRVSQLRIFLVWFRLFDILINFLD